MSTAVQAKELYVNTYAQVAKQLAGAHVPWIEQTRQQALTRFSDQGFPTAHDEDWKYTSVTPLQRHAFKPARLDAKPLTQKQLAPFLLYAPDLPRMVFVNGHYIESLSDIGKLPSGVVATSLARALEDQAEHLQEHLGRYAPIDKHGFAALNTAFLSDGAYIFVPQDAALTEPLHLLFIATADVEPVLAQPRNVIVAKENSQAKLIESYVGLDDARYFTNTISEIAISEGAALEHYKLGEESLKAYHIGGVHVRQAGNSRFVSHNVAAGGALMRNDIDVVFTGEGADCELNGLYLVSGRQHVDNHTRIDHAKPGCSSREFYKGVLDGRGRAVFNGRIIVHQDAQHTDAQQQNKNLLLSGDAEIDTKPQLEIYADDVKCAHGATVGQLDSDA
ncbi:MAG: Fe-S cluster assembly protein SufD, partial [Acidiferrobacterales bacterium]|nr:Fe-S cluster assembly protein SufD [Acidiferrobacterales bacterium]